VVKKEVLAGFENGKLARDEVLYCEFVFDGLETKKRVVERESKYPDVVREYNFLVDGGVHFADYSVVIKEANPYILSVKPLDVYKGKGVPEGKASVLVSVIYNSDEKTLEAAEITEIENKFLNKLKKEFGIALKQ
jgi:phenylalanyl-tRNA synthetase beta chain